MLPDGRVLPPRWVIKDMMVRGGRGAPWVTYSARGCALRGWCLRAVCDSSCGLCPCGCLGRGPAMPTPCTRRWLPAGCDVVVPCSLSAVRMDRAFKGTRLASPFAVAIHAGACLRAAVHSCVHNGGRPFVRTTQCFEGGAFPPMHCLEPKLPKRAMPRWCGLVQATRLLPISRGKCRAARGYMLQILCSAVLPEPP